MAFMNNCLIGLYEKAFPSDYSLEKCLDMTKELGYDFFELSIDESDEKIDRLSWSGEERTAVLNMIENASVKGSIINGDKEV